MAKIIFLFFICSSILIPQTRIKNQIVKSDSSRNSKIVTNKHDSVSTKSNKEFAPDTQHVVIDNLPEPESFWFRILEILLPTGLIAFISIIVQRNLAFNNTFFDLLNQQNEILNRISVKVQMGIYEKINFFEHFKRIFEQLYKLMKQELPDNYNFDGLSFFNQNLIMGNELNKLYKEIKQLKEKIFSDLRTGGSIKENKGEVIAYEHSLSIIIYSFLIDKYANPLRNYFRHLYHIYDYLDTSWFIFGKKKLVNLIQARMTDAELFVLFYNGFKYQRMFDYITKYNITENLYIEDLLNPIHKELYNVKMKSKEDRVEYSPMGKKVIEELEKIAASKDKNKIK